MGRSEIVPSRVYEVLYSCVISSVAPSKTMLLWSDGKAVSIYVRAGRRAVLSGANTALPLTEKKDLLLHLSHIMKFWYLNIAFNSW